jgi:hypothetical protein
MKSTKKKIKAWNRPKGECTIPPRPVKHFLKSYTLYTPGNVREISKYVEWQARGEKVQHAEKVKTEHLLGRDYDCWDVHTRSDRYWVITSPTNLYSQELFPSLDYTLSFHVGVMIRVESLQKGAPDQAQNLRLMPIWRRWQEASTALGAAEESEDFQAVGMRCRECLIRLVRSIGKPEMVPKGSEPPKRADVVGWSEHIANTFASGSSGEHLRGHLKSIVKSTWQMAQGLTHAGNATRWDAGALLHATEAVVVAYGSALMRYESGIPDQCPKCGSYNVAVGYKPATRGGPHRYISNCEKCNWWKRVNAVQ